nr:MAG TPA: hypothetical protein [Caudoviricetes sp.]
MTTCKIIARVNSLAIFMYSINEPIHLLIDAVNNNYIFSVISSSK